MTELKIEVKMPKDKMAKDLFIITLYTYKYIGYDDIENFDTQEKLENIQNKALKEYDINPSFHKEVHVILDSAKEYFNATK